MKTAVCIALSEGPPAESRVVELFSQALLATFVAETVFEAELLADDYCHDQGFNVVSLSEDGAVTGVVDVTLQDIIRHQPCSFREYLSRALTGGDGLRIESYELTDGPVDKVGLLVRGTIRKEDSACSGICISGECSS